MMNGWMRGSCAFDKNKTEKFFTKEFFASKTLKFSIPPRGDDNSIDAEKAETFA